MVSLEVPYGCQVHTVEGECFYLARNNRPVGLELFANAWDME